jgi:hypothetical protein
LGEGAEKEGAACGADARLRESRADGRAAGADARRRQPVAELGEEKTEVAATRCWEECGGRSRGGNRAVCSGDVGGCRTACGWEVDARSGAFGAGRGEARAERGV